MAEPDGSIPTPNTLLERRLVSSKVILCCGEDEGQLTLALREAGVGRPLEEGGFRSYRYWKYPEFTLILCGIGTGCIEPLLYELFSFNIVREIVLVGTAGLLPGSKLPLGAVCQITEAWLAGTALDREVRCPLRPRFPLADAAWLPGASSVSTDFYYGFQQPGPGVDYPLKFPHLRRAVEEFAQRVDFVEMEVGQFYAFCDAMPHTGEVRRLAIKGAANALGKHEDQVSHTGDVLKRAFEIALRVLRVRL